MGRALSDSSNQRQQHGLGIKWHSCCPLTPKASEGDARRCFQCLIRNLQVVFDEESFKNLSSCVRGVWCYLVQFVINPAGAGRNYTWSLKDPCHSGAASGTQADSDISNGTTDCYKMIKKNWRAFCLNRKSNNWIHH